MSVSYVNFGEESLLFVDAQRHTDKTQQLLDMSVSRLIALSRRYVYFHIAMFVLLFCECAFLVSSFFWLAETALLSLSFAGLFLSFLAYFILRLYFQGKKPELIAKLKEEYVAKSREILFSEAKDPKGYLAMASSCWKLAKKIHGLEYRLYSIPGWLRSLQLRAAFEKMSCLCHWEDLYRFKELLLLQAITEHIELVKCAPTSLEVHAALANAYVILSELYSKNNLDDEKWNPAYWHKEELLYKFRTTAEKAVEELKILEEYAPQNSWVHAQLAYSYRDLKMPQQEIKEYEAMLRLNHQDKAVLAKLGVLYFSQGRKAEGLRVYEALRKLDPMQAEQLITHYGNHG
jgi:tetratricopeptide (TPR) repeat protein